MNALIPSKLLVSACINVPFFRKSDTPDLEWDLHFPMNICSPYLLLNRPSNRDPTDNAFDQQAKAFFNFATTIAVMEPPCPEEAQAGGRRNLY